MNWFPQPINLALNLDNEAQAHRLTTAANIPPVASAQDEPQLQDSIEDVLGSREPITSHGCLLEAPIPEGYWRTATAPNVALCHSCYATFVKPTILAGQWQFVTGTGAVCDMPVKAIRDAWKSAIIQAQHEGVEICTQRFGQQAQAVLTRIEIIQRHISALVSTMQYFQQSPVQTNESARIVAAKQQEIARLNDEQNCLSGRDVYGRLTWM